MAKDSKIEEKEETFEACVQNCINDSKRVVTDPEHKIEAMCEGICREKFNL